jgi:predicted membrane channel-forming protein YqfA (hemolysin III family)
MMDAFPQSLSNSPECELRQASGLVDPRLHLCGCGMLLLLICFIFRCSSPTLDAYIAIFCLICNLICFLFSAFCHWVFNSVGRNSSGYFRLDYVGIILHIWATSVSVLLLEIDNDRISRYGISGLSLVSLTAAVCLLFLSLEKRVRVAVIGGTGSLAFLVVLLLVTASSGPSRLNASYSAMVVINGVGGWYYLQQSYKPAQSGLSGPSTAKGHTIMHICSVFASMLYGIALVQFVCPS